MKSEEVISKEYKRIKSLSNEDLLEEYRIRVIHDETNSGFKTYLLHKIEILKRMDFGELV